MLNFFTFNQNFLSIRENMILYKNSLRKICAVSFANEGLNGHYDATSRALSGPRSHDAGPLPPWFLPFSLHWSVLRQSYVVLSLVEREIKSQPLDFTNAIDGSEFFTCIWSRSSGPRSTSLTRALSRALIQCRSSCHVACIHKECISPTWERNLNQLPIKGRNSFSVCVAHWA